MFWHEDEMDLTVGSYYIGTIKSIRQELWRPDRTPPYKWLTVGKQARTPHATLDCMHVHRQKNWQAETHGSLLRSVDIDEYV
jgi:hypothetical protein